MRPPICELCGGEAEETVRFADYEPLPQGMTGHPRGLGWFCRRHLPAARELRGMVMGDALGALGGRWRGARLAASGFLVAVCAALAILGHHPAVSRTLVYVFKPLATLSIIALAAWPRPLNRPGYRAPILVGLVFALCGDVLLIWPDRFFLAGLASFAVTHVCYLVALRSGVGWAPRWAPFAVFGGVAAVLLVVLWPGLAPGLKIPVVVYAALLAAMTAQATGRAMQLARHSAWIAAAGALLFLCSDSVLALNRFRFPFEASRIVVLSTYFTAQWLIALSVELYGREA